MTIQPISGEDVLVWPDGSWCYREDHSEIEDAWRGDDFIVYPAGSAEALVTTAEQA